VLKTGRRPCSRRGAARAQDGQDGHSAGLGGGAVTHALSFEQHVVVMPLGAYRPLSWSDHTSRARALVANPPADIAWREILADAQARAKP